MDTVFSKFVHICYIIIMSCKIDLPFHGQEIASEVSLLMRNIVQYSNGLKKTSTVRESIIPISIVFYTHFQLLAY